MVRMIHTIPTLVFLLLVQILSLLSRVHPAYGFQTGEGRLILFLSRWRRQFRKHAVFEDLESVEEEDSIGNTTPNFKVAEFNVKETIERCVLDRSISADVVIGTLKSLENQQEQTDSDSASLLSRSHIISMELVSGTFELVFCSAVNVMGLNGYLPNREIISFDFEARWMSLKVETFSLLPTINIIGNDLTWYDTSNTLTYKVVGKKKQSRWKILYADESVMAAESSVTGFNVLRRIQPLSDG